MENITIKNPKVDSYGNARENVFLAFDRNQNYLGSGYIFVNINEDMAPKHPLNIYIDINMANEDEIGNDVSCHLFERLIERANQVKEENVDIQARLYNGSIGKDRKKYNFFISKGFVHDEGTYLLEVDMTKYVIEKKDIELIEIKENILNQTKEQERLIHLHNSIFIKTIDQEFITELNKYELTKHYTAYHNHEMIGHIIIYVDTNHEEMKKGKIENLFVLKEWRKKGIAKALLDVAMSNFKENGIKHVQLEVWSANKVAYAFYKNLGFSFIEETELYPGIYL